MEYRYRGWIVFFGRMSRTWIAHDPSQHISKTKVTATNQQAIIALVDAATPNYQAPAFRWMAA